MRRPRRSGEEPKGDPCQTAVLVVFPSFHPELEVVQASWYIDDVDPESL